MPLSTQSPYDLKLASMQIPEAVATVSLSLKGQQTDRATNTLLLHPGEPSEIGMQLRNLSNHSLRWWVDVKGDFPAEWCDWQQPEVEELAVQTGCDRTLRFQVPEDYFEELQALHPGKSRLQLDFEVQIAVYAEMIAVATSNGAEASQEASQNEWLSNYLRPQLPDQSDNPQQQLIGYQIFNLQVRPNNRYLKFLPALYREIDFVGRFLTIFEQTFDPAVQTMDVLWAYLDPLTAPEALLPFLSRWVAWELSDRWSLKQQRRFIKNAITLYRWHGTRRGLRFYLHLYTGLPLDDHIPNEVDKHICIEEVFSAGFVMNQTRIGQDSMLGGGRPYHFIVRLRSEATRPIDEMLVREIIERQKPAFCSYELQILPP